MWSWETHGGSSSWGRAINDIGTVVRYSTTLSNVAQAFVFTNGGKMQDLKKPVPKKRLALFRIPDRRGEQPIVAPGRRSRRGERALEEGL
ncbi:MAG: hypothetical protein ACR2II_01530 [Chthoniobacterales bacterium]